ncbi:MAG: hypothetical protein B7Y16_06050 [Methylotenera sp. 24-45-7]|jgi:hypothetical protein|nr:MAG: hypothetical protein B7Y72_08590 [Mehylophilales bacterium 35-46-6]OYZ40394.1 MAG: hypothetical protein B7Y16_06050 [Methylotenera sp. 24-45-7]OZA08953.1 MAG: hypothetical protein B7X97_04415 [Methylotenera sp. 17-45-7]OZA54363.1 MAG: hypothetical protein B7X73_01045 [Methylophilales bacterium 39-45-7]HQS36603.1 PA2779 family protein [Methylotenera sp.]
MIFVKRFLSAFLAVSILFTGSIQTVQAAMISTEQVAAASAFSAAGNDDRSRIVAALSREDVQAAMVARGIDPAQAQGRVAAMTDEEASVVASQLDTAPAGGIIGVIVLIFLVLLLTDILGFTKVYPFTRSVR